MLRITRSGMLEVLGSDFIKLVRLKGVPERIVVARHALKNSMIPVLTFAGLNLLIMVNVARRDRGSSSTGPASGSCSTTP